MRNTGYVGANDGGSSTAILLELANQFRGKKRDGYSVWLLWTDGEEAVQESGPPPTASTASRHLAEKWQQDGTLKSVKAFLLADMIGDADLNVERDSRLHSVAGGSGLSGGLETGLSVSLFRDAPFAVEDDHLPFVERGVPSC